MLPQKAIQEFKIIYLKIFGVELSDEEATKKANNFVDLYKAVYGDIYLGKRKNNENKKA